MDLSDVALKGAPAGRRVVEPLDPQALIAQLGSEVATTLSSALNRVAELSQSGRIDRDNLAALHAEIDLARRAGIMGQQVVRLSNGDVQLVRERLDVTTLLREALRQRARVLEVQGIEVRQEFVPALVMSDATLLFSLLETALDWALEHTVSRVDLKLSINAWPAHAVLGVKFAYQPADEVDSAPMPLAAAPEVEALNTMSWRLLQQTATVLGLQMHRRDPAGRTELTLEFPETLAPRLEPAGTTSVEETVLPLISVQPMAGSHVLVLATRREVRNVVREALRPMGLMVDFVANVDELQQQCSEAMPDAVIYEASLGGQRFERIRAELLAASTRLAFIQIAEQGKVVQRLNLGGRQYTSVGRDAIIDALPEVLTAELSRSP
jgi:hypothetical protein